MTKLQSVRPSISKAGHISLFIPLLLLAPLLTFAELLADTAVGNGIQLSLPKENKLIYKSVDAQGRVSFGDEPGANTVELETLERPSYQQNSSAEELQTRLDQMAATTKRLQEDRKLRSKLRQDEAEAKRSHYQPPVVVVENRVYHSPRRYLYLYKPRLDSREKHRVSHLSGSFVRLQLGGGNSTFRYGLSYGSHQKHTENPGIQTPYRRESGHIRSSGIIKRRQY